jgi:preprotein translocase subunit YajC
MTSGGLIGRVKDIKDIEADGVKETRVTVETGSATVVVERSRIVRVGGASAPGATST